MIYGLYLSATGVLASSYRQDVIANNLANVETVGFKRDLAVFAQQRTEAQLRGLNPSVHSDRVLEGLGGGLSVLPTRTDISPGEMETTGNALDLAIQGPGFFAVRDRGRTLLTRDGRFLVDRTGQLVRAAGGQLVLDDKGNPLQLDRGQPVLISHDGAVSQGGQVVGRIGVFEPSNPSRLRKQGASLLSCGDEKDLRPVAALLRTGCVERSNADPTLELTSLLETERQLEANANLIRYQDQTLSRLVNDVGRIG